MIYSGDAKSEEFSKLVIGAAIEVHRELGPGYLESIYEEALSIEFDLRGIAYERQVPIKLLYKNRPIGDNRLDFLVGGRLVVELKAVTAFCPNSSGASYFLSEVYTTQIRTISEL